MCKRTENMFKITDSAFYGLTIMDLRVLVYEYCTRYCIPHSFNRGEKIAGRDYVNTFLKRKTDLPLREPQGVALNRIYGIIKLILVYLLKIWIVFHSNMLLNLIRFTAVIKLTQLAFINLMFVKFVLFGYMKVVSIITYVFCVKVILKMIFVSGNHTKISWKLQRYYLISWHKNHFQNNNNW